jgi:phosphotransferase system enzyme I (PtsI)
MRVQELSSGVLRGIGVSIGVSIGRCLLLEFHEGEPGQGKVLSGDTQVTSPEEEADRFALAVEEVKKELQRIGNKIGVEADPDVASIFEAQVLMLEDPLFMSQVINGIHDDQLTAEEAVNQTMKELKKRFSGLSPYMRQRGEDVGALGARLIDVLMGRHEHIPALAERIKRERVSVVLASRNVAAATIAQFERSFIAGIVTEEGSMTSHLAIMARSLKIPTVAGVKEVTRQLKDGDQILVDGDRGEVIISPTEAEVQNRIRPLETGAAKTVSDKASATTRDHHTVQVFANVANSDEVKEALRNGAEGIGLFRTEFLYFNRENPPTENELFNIFKQSASIMKGKTIIVRTLDIGGDKKPTYLKFPDEKNPMLGLRGIRYSLRNPSLMETQISAVLRASAYGDMRIMFPMISTVDEFMEAKSLEEKVKKRLERKGALLGSKVEVGIMIETPSAALVSDRLAKEADFLSIGTNDLVQYTLAADRENENVAANADPLDPSVLKLIQETIDNGHARSRHVGMCGEMAADIDAVPILLGMGLDEFSVDVSNIDQVKRNVRSISYTESRKAASEVVKMDSARQVRSYSKSRLR